MSPETFDLFLLGVALVGFGAAGYRHAYEIAWLGEVIDSFDFVTPTTAFRPAERDVRLTRAFSVVGAIAGLALIVVFLEAALG